MGLAAATTAGMMQVVVMLGMVGQTSCVCIVNGILLDACCCRQVQQNAMKQQL